MSTATIIENDLNMAKVQRNSPCQCGSGRKYKKCCGSVTVPMSETGSKVERLVRAYSDETGNSGNKRSPETCYD